jgi:hypothetical protein
VARAGKAWAAEEAVEEVEEAVEKEEGLAGTLR